MNLIEQLHRDGYLITPKFDGEIMRFQMPDGGEDPSGWFIGATTKLPNGKEILHGSAGDWRKSNKALHHYQSDEALTPEESKLFESAKAEQTERASKEREEGWRRGASKAAYIWSQSLDRERSTTKYLQVKKLTSLYGARISSLDTTKLVVPVRDTGTGELTSLQFIEASGKKNFLKLGRIQGCSHLIGEIHGEKPICIAEGFATAASVHQATGYPCFVALNAGNLRAVAETVRARYPDAHIVICADDDRLTDKNPGRTKGMEAARAIGGSCLLPIFSPGTLSIHPSVSDYSDLLCLEGVDVVASQITSSLLEGPPKGGEDAQLKYSEEGASQNLLQNNTDLIAAENEPKEDYVLPLGFSGNKYYYTTSSNQQINGITEHSEEGLLKLMPLQYWKCVYGYDEEITEGRGKEKKVVAVVRKVSWPSVKSQLMEDCREMGIFDNRRVRGPGVWMDQGKVVVHLGDRLFYDGRDHTLQSLKSVNIYTLGAPLPAIHSQPLKFHELGLFHDVLGLLNYTSPEQKIFLGGWIALALICGVLPWKPHGWLTGEQGSGKTTVFEQIIMRFMAAFKYGYFQGNSTEAGVRQDMAGLAVPVLFDEFETNTERAAGRVEQIVELFRQASSEGGGSIVKGSSNGEAIEYHVRFMGMVASIGTKLTSGADKSRFTLIELKKMGAGEREGQFEELLEQISLLDEEYCRRFFARMVQMVPVVLANQKKLQKLFAAKHSNRFGQQYGTLLAGWASMIGDGELTDARAKELVEQVVLEREIAATDSQDQEECLQHLMEKQIRIGNTSMSINQIFHEGRDPRLLKWEDLGGKPKDGDQWGAIKKHLIQVGVYPTCSKDLGAGILVLGSHPQLSDLFRGTRWNGAWAQSLGRLPGAKKSHRVKYQGNLTPRGVFVPKELFIGEADDPDEIVDTIHPEPAIF